MPSSRRELKMPVICFILSLHFYDLPAHDYSHARRWPARRQYTSIGIAAAQATPAIDARTPRRPRRHDSDLRFQRGGHGDTYRLMNALVAELRCKVDYADMRDEERDLLPDADAGARADFEQQR